MSDIRIIYEDSQVLAADKPAGQPAIPGRGDIGTPFNAALEAHLGRGPQGLGSDRSVEDEHEGPPPGGAVHERELGQRLARAAGAAQ